MIDLLDLPPIPPSKGPRAREGSLDPTLRSVVPDIKSSLTQNLWEGAGLLYSSQLCIA